MPLPPAFTLRDFQGKIITESEEILASGESLLVASPTGSGKCHPAGTLIMMHDGSNRAVEDILPGDQLMGPDSNPRNVMSVSTGYGPIVEIQPTRGKPWRCNDEHVLTLVRTGERNDPGRPEYGRGGEIIDISVRQYLKESDYFKHIHKLSRAGEITFQNPRDKRSRNVPAYILGLLIGDGDLTNGRVGITTTDEPIVEELRAYAARTQTNLAKSDYSGRAPTYYFRRKNPVTGNWPRSECRLLGIAEHRAADKFIPTNYMTAPPEDRLELLAGLLDTDGYLGGAVYEYSSKSRVLAEDVCFVARSLGFAAILAQKIVMQGIYWRVLIAGDTDRIPCRLTRKQAQPRRQKKNPLRTGFRVRNIGPAPFYGFTLDGDGRYLLADFTVTHNTVCLAEISARRMLLGQRIGVLVHRQELVAQSEEKVIRQCQEMPGIIWKDRREWDRPVIIMAQDTLAGLEIPEWLRLDLLIIDEAHHAVAPSWIRTIQRLAPRDLLGFSATPFRQDREPLTPEPFSKVLRPITPMELIRMKLLCPAVIESPVIHDRNGEIQPINQASNPEHIYHQAVRYALAQGRTRVILYASQTRTSTPMQVIRKTTQLLQDAGITADAIYQNISSAQRRNAISRFQNSASASVLLNYMALTEGTDIPNVDCVIIGRHTESESTIIQMIGRGLRPYGLKEDCLVLEYTGRPDMSDIIHYWRIDNPEPEPEGKEKSERPKNNTPEELDELATRFPRQLSLLDDTRIRYPWFRPFEDHPIMALPVWSNKNEAGRYVVVEPLRKGGWKFSTVTLMDSGPSQMRREQKLMETAEETAAQVRMSLGHMAPLLERDAAWRQKAASIPQQSAWRRLHPRDPRDPAELKAGEIWDAISRERFQRRVGSGTL